MVAKKTPLKSRRERGSVAIEMALVLPLLLLIVAGIVDLGILFWEKEVLTNASREGARAGAKAVGAGVPEKKTANEVMAIVKNYLDKYELKDAAGASLTLEKNTNFYYQWDLTNTPADLWVELRNIPVKMMLLPNIGKLFSGTVSNIVYLDAKTTMTAEWNNATPPTP